MEPYRTLYPRAGENLPETEKMVERVLVLPTGTAVNTEDIHTICQLLHFCVEHAAQIEQTKAMTRSAELSALSIEI